MKIWNFPLLKVTIFFIIGLLLSYFLKPVPTTVITLLGATFIIFILFYYLSKKHSTISIYFGIITCLQSLTIGMTTQTLHTETFQPKHYNHYKNIHNSNHVFILTVKERLKSTHFRERYLAQVNSINGKETSGKILLNIEKDSLTQYQFTIGNQLKIEAQLIKNSNQKNPNQFDYSKYLENKQIYAQLFVKLNQIQLGSKKTENIWYYAAALRSKIIKNLEKSKFNSKELNVAIALIIGQQQDIDPEIIQDYQYAGAVHILSVSGLHIGFLLLFINFLLKPFPNSPKSNLLKLTTTLILLFLFGIFTGLSASVVRSVVMFSFVAIGLYLRRSTNIYHTLSISILVILLFEPSFLFDLGFQLSYLAVFFIIWLQPLLASIWKPKNKIANYFWDILTISFAAQIGTLPLSIYYFHQFPGLFFLTNILIIPLLGLIMGLGVLVMFFAAFNWVSVYTINALELSIFCLNKIIETVASFEQFIIKDIPLNIPLLLNSYLVIITLVLALKFRTFKNCLATLSAIILLQLSYIATKWETQKQAEFIVFNTYKQTQIIERKGTNATLYANNFDIKNTPNEQVSSYLTSNFSSLQHQYQLKNLFYFEDKKILLIDSTTIYPTRIHPDIIIITQSAKINLERLLQIAKPKNIVADASNYKNIQQIWARTCAKKKIPFHSTNEKGFFRIN
ncbi:ComEC/Rec2 family competence protein [Flavobacterium adhaerens]|uniref:ComEC/Rec2 family competence protein n=1 Tax=Flavobacterium adhaerens TaxID=3149043 RepID=UPI0032B50B6A